MNPWVICLGRVSYLRGHLSVYAVGSVLLLALNLLFGDGGIWADTAIGAWGILVIAHGILIVIARLLRELLADEDKPVQPASNAGWETGSGWTLPMRSRQEPSPTTPPAPTSPPTSPKLPPEPAAPSPTSGEGERVSWKEATKAAWHTPRDEPTKPDDKNNDDQNDFQPLKLD